MQKAIQSKTQPMQMSITFETLAVITLFSVSLLLRLLALGDVPLAESEIKQALSAWQLDTVSNSPVVFWAQKIMFDTLGASELTARLITALAGVALSLSPLLFRDMLGRARAFIFALLLIFSPVLLVTSRSGAGAVWALLFAVLSLWALWQFWQTSNKVFGVLTIVMLGALLFLSEPGGPVLGLILLGSGAIALSLSVMGSPDDDAVPGDVFLEQIQKRFEGFPFKDGVLLAALVILVVSTGFLFHFSGFGMIGALLGDFFGGFTQATPDVPIVYALVLSLFYEPWVWLLAIMAIVFIVRRDELIFLERFFVAWLLMAALGSLIYMGAEAAHSVWFVIPLAGLASYLISDALVEYDLPIFFMGGSLFDNEGDFHLQSMAWVKWVIGLVMFTLIVIAVLQLQVVTRLIVVVPEGSFSEFWDRLIYIRHPKPSPTTSGIWMLLSIMFMMVGGLLAASIWGNKVTVQGGVLGLTGFALMASFAIGWNLSVADSDDARELWYTQATSQNAGLLRETLLDFSFRETQGFNLIPIAVVGDDDSGVLAWLLRDFPNAYYVDSVEATKTEQFIIAPDNFGEPPDLGGSYVGQPFTLSYTWSTDSMLGLDFLTWWVVGETRVDRQALQRVALWVRQDVYEGQPVR